MHARTPKRRDTCIRLGRAHDVIPGRQMIPLVKYLLKPLRHRFRSSSTPVRLLFGDPDEGFDRPEWDAYYQDGRPIYFGYMAGGLWEIALHPLDLFPGSALFLCCYQPERPSVRLGEKNRGLAPCG